MSNRIEEDIDDQDPRVRLVGEWSRLTGFGNAYDQTASFATSPGATIVLNFNASSTGTWVNVYGFLLPGSPPPISTYSVDGSPIITFVSDGVTKETDNVQYYSSSLFTGGVHQLIVNVTQCSNESPFYVDYFKVLSFPSSSSSVAPATSSSSASVSTNAAATTQATAASGKSTNVGAIAGGVIGGVAILVATVAAVFFFCRRNKTRSPILAATRPFSREFKGITPYFVPTEAPLLPSGPAQDSGSSIHFQAISHASAPSSSGDYGNTPMPGPSETVPSATSRRSVIQSSPNQPISKAAQAGLLSVPRPLVFHADAGVSLDRSTDGAPSHTVSIHSVNPDNILDAPPSYSAD
ncbi:hypothetical protein CERSUDRAFT_91713 [Gelatoporia subvermispora B]|uniref:Mid2 domain-containing protein n=1 Tax=Ceriporiopsis subvermispora (strain B) TaxID=914234 RepID=M2R985_CERS8|nr:hypothetical protein CERSUDRAFT_91713 [Gelatoporia subvermispora B]